LNFIHGVCKWHVVAIVAYLELRDRMLAWIVLIPDLSGHPDDESVGFVHLDDRGTRAARLDAVAHLHPASEVAREDRGRPVLDLKVRRTYPSLLSRLGRRAILREAISPREDGTVQIRGGCHHASAMLVLDGDVQHAIIEPLGQEHHQLFATTTPRNNSVSSEMLKGAELWPYQSGSGANDR
jgi:hypothetical protein